MNPRRLVHVRIIREDRGNQVLFAAQCLEYDICAQGDTPVKALEAFRITAMGQVVIDKKRGTEPLSKLPCAPISLWCGIHRDDLAGVYLDELLKAQPTDQGVANGRRNSDPEN